MVVVTFNYRVGPYGFLAGEEIEKGASLNNGLKDQRKALKWVQKHISKVGQLAIIPRSSPRLISRFDTVSSLVEIPNMLLLVVVVQVLPR
jgi:hypothetical protein